ncbi:hypothetical protein [Actinoplanes sp. NPDC049316]|uniref:hypothetical protein n=1 Tax=Actinoplanes sp. NPDC049316 TaxID=3154727 RepID=UPI00341B09E1
MTTVRAIAIMGAALGMALMTGCTNGVEQTGGIAAPAGEPPSSSAPAAPGTATPSATPSRTPAPPSPSPTTASPAGSQPARTATAPRVLGPFGLGALRLGMTREQAEATGMIQGYRVEDFTGSCGIAKVRGTTATVFFTPGLGLSNIDMYGSVRTPEGIRLGSSMSAVQRAYPDWEEVLGGGDNGYGWAVTPGNGQAKYRIDVKDARVTSVDLSLKGQKCVE